MKRIAMVAVLMCAATAATANPALNVEVVFPTSTTWELWGNLIENTAGLCSYAIEISGITTMTNKSPKAILLDEGGDPIGSIGFSNGVDVARAEPGTYQLFKWQDTSDPTGLIYQVGVAAQTITSWPGATSMIPGTITIGMPAQLYIGKRAVDGPVVIDLTKSKANVFDMVGGVTVTEVPVIPEPATLALLTLGGLAALRRRR